MGDVKMAAGAAAPIIEKFRDLAAEFGNSAADFKPQSAKIGSGCAEFADLVTDASTAHHIAWSEVFRFYSDTSALIAGNTNVFDIDLKRLDQDAAHQLDI